MPVTDYKMPRFGQIVTVAKTADETLGNISATYVKFVAKSSNAGTTGYKGTSTSSEAQGSGDTVAMAAGADSGWIPCFNLNQFSVVVASGDTLYVVIGK